MASIQNTQPRKGFITRLFANYWERKVEVFRRQLVAKTIGELENKSDAQLKDLGLARHEIKQAAYRSVYHGRLYCH